MVFIVCNDRGLSDIQVYLLTLSKAHVGVKHKAQGRELAWQKDSNLAHWSVLDNVKGTDFGLLTVSQVLHFLPLIKTEYFLCMID